MFFKVKNESLPSIQASRVSTSPVDSFGYPDGVTARDLAPADVRHLVLEHFDKFPPADPRVHYLLGTLYIVLGLASAIGNYYVLKIFIKYKHLRTPSNLLIINLAFCDFMLFAGLYPELIVNSFWTNGVWMFGEIPCLIHSWCGCVFGFGQMITLSAISYDRYYVVVKGLPGAPLTYQRTAVLLVYVWIVSLFWGTVPFFGLGRYTLDGILSSCSYDYLSQELNVYIYVGGSWLFGFFIPIATILYCYAYIVKTTCNHGRLLQEQAKKMGAKSNTDDDEGMAYEIKMSKIALVNIVLWLFAWTPFAVMSFVGLYDPLRITPLLSSLPVVIAKSSSVYNPIIYSLSHSKYQKCLRKELGWLCSSAKKKEKSKDATSTATGFASTSS